MYAIQHRHYQYQDRTENKTTEIRSGEYHMAFVEFDDQGWFADRRQMEALFMLLGELEAGNRHTLMLVYAHGWKHNASACDNNVYCFSRLVERMDILERNLGSAGARDEKDDGPPRHVVAIYIGWRGLSVKGELLSNISFWTRKATAERVGRGGVKELLTRLEDYRRIRNPQHDELKTQLVITGHSFGGLAIHAALSHAVVERAVGVSREPASRAEGVTKYRTARSYGDLIVLVNPAFEGSLYEPLLHVATNRCYGRDQRPVMLTVTSVGDTATGLAFPLGRGLDTLFEHAGSTAQGESIRQTVGHDPRYETHQLKWRGSKAQRGSGQEVRVAEEEECGCPYLDRTEDFKWWEFVGQGQLPGQGELPLVRRPQTEAGRAASPPPPLPADIESGRRIYRAYGDQVALSGDMKYSANYPYLVITTDAEIIASHNAIYSEPFVEFLHKFFLVHIANGRPFEADVCHRDFAGCLPGGLIPCERSCQLQTGEACTSQREAGEKTGD